MLVTLPKWASLSDVYGRKALIQIALISLTMSQLITWFAASPHNPIGYRLLYVDGALSGITAGGALFHPAFTAYVGKVFLAKIDACKSCNVPRPKMKHTFSLQLTARQAGQEASH